MNQNAVTVKRILDAARSGGELARAGADLLRRIGPRPEMDYGGEGQITDAEREAFAAGVRQGKRLFHESLANEITTLRAELDARGAAETIVQMAETYGVLEELELQAMFQTMRATIDAMEKSYNAHLEM